MKSCIKIALCSIVAMALVRLAVMALVPPFESSEARYATISANMARTGNWFVPSFTYEGVYQPFAGKPPLSFQASALACKVFGVNGFAVRLPSLLSFFALLAILYWTVKRRAYRRAGDSEMAPALRIDLCERRGRSPLLKKDVPYGFCGEEPPRLQLSAAQGASCRATGVLAVSICATIVSLFAISGICMTDAPLMCCVSGALLIYSTREVSLYPAIAVLLALGTAIKGPVALAMFGLPVVAESIVNRRLPPMPLKNTALALLAYIALTVPYFAAIEHSQPGFLKYFFINENLMRFLVHDYGDRYGAGRETFRGMAVIWALVATLPWSLVPVVKRRLPSLSFNMIAIISITAFWCLTSRVPFTYLLPVAPLFAAHLAEHSAEFGISRRRLLRLVPPAAILASIVLCGAMGYTYIFNRKKMPGPSAPQRISDHYFSYEFYNGPWGKGAPE